MTLFPIIVEGKCGFIDPRGNVVVKPQYRSGCNSTEGLARVKIAGQWGFINEAGELAIEPRFDNCRWFSGGYAAVEIEKQWGFIDARGQWQIEPRYFDCFAFEEGLARVQDSMTAPYVFVDPVGNVVLKGFDFIVSQHREGLVNYKHERQWGFLDSRGNVRIEPQYSYARPFCEGLAAVVRLKKRNEFVFINPRNEVEIASAVRGADVQFSEGRCAVWDKKSRKYGYIDRSGTVVIDYGFYLAQHFSEGLAVVRLEDDDPYGYLDLSGAMAIAPRFTIAGSFQDGLGQVIVGERFEDHEYGYVDRSGEYVWKPSR